MRKKNRKILLFVDNAICHPKVELSNIKLLFFPPNMTAEVQSLDQGVIMNLKLQYRKKLLEHCVINAENCENAQAFMKNITSLDAIRWISFAWSKLSSITIQKCFQKAGFLYQNISQVLESGTQQEESIDIKQFTDLISYQFHTDISTEEYLNFDNQLPTTEDIGDTIEEITDEILSEALDLYTDSEENKEKNKEMGTSIIEMDIDDQLVTFQEIKAQLINMRKYHSKFKLDIIANLMDIELFL